MRIKRTTERRSKMRFPMNRELRYKLLDGERIVASGLGTTTDMSSGGVAFNSDKELPNGSFVELSISWPALLNEVCPMRLIVFGCVIRGMGETKVCSVQKWEFRTQASRPAATMPIRVDNKLQRWAEYRREVTMRNSEMVLPA